MARTERWTALPRRRCAVSPSMDRSGRSPGLRRLCRRAAPVRRASVRPVSSDNSRRCSRTSPSARRRRHAPPARGADRGCILAPLQPAGRHLAASTARRRHCGRARRVGPSQGASGAVGSRAGRCCEAQGLGGGSVAADDSEVPLLTQRARLEMAIFAVTRAGGCFRSAARMTGPVGVTARPCGPRGTI